MGEILNSMRDIIDSSDGGDPGTPDRRAIWLFGIEPGFSKSDQAHAALGAEAVQDAGYSVETQSQWVFNRNAFRLLAAIAGQASSDWQAFAKANRPFVHGCTGYFKGNLFPVACNNLDDWPDEARKVLGSDKQAFYRWCREERYPEIAKLVKECRPRLIIGVGVGVRNEFQHAFFGSSAPGYIPYAITANQRVRRLYCQESDGVRLVVIPHLSPRGPYCLSSNEAIDNAGRFIREWSTA